MKSRFADSIQQIFMQDLFDSFTKLFVMLLSFFDSKSHLGPIPITAEIFEIVIEALTKPQADTK